MEGGKGLICAQSRGVWENVGLGPHIHTKGWKLVKGTNEWCVVS
jgi:hypothetical protein